MKVLVAGDFCPRYRIADKIECGDYQSFFSDVKECLEKVDYSILNLESPVVEHPATPIEKSGPCLKCSSKTIGAVKWAGFDCVTLANNHFYDFGEVGVEDTIGSLSSNSIDYVGGGHNIAEASSILYKTINGQCLAIINCCEHEFSIAGKNQGGSNPINPIQQFYAIKEARKKADKVLVVAHGGIEHYQLPAPRLKELLRFFIDAGADAVVNHHQHCYSGYERYKNGVIFYGLGNFCFDRKKVKDRSWREGFMVTLDFLDDKVDFMLHPYVQCAEDAKVRVISGTAESDAFREAISSLNSIIEDDVLLESEYRKLLDKTRLNYMAYVAPYNNRYFEKLYRLGFLPTFLGKRRRLALVNIVLCESHKDRFIYAVKNTI